jgi:EAL domain-containing protein (putative c-di-GMP-specific phosphodiesterase class I)
VVIRAIAALGAGLGMTTTVEGVVTAEQAVLVESDGCTDIQGYLISQPIQPAEIDASPCRHAITPDSVSTTG